MFTSQKKTADFFFPLHIPTVTAGFVEQTWLTLQFGFIRNNTSPLGSSDRGFQAPSLIPPSFSFSPVTVQMNISLNIHVIHILTASSLLLCQTTSLYFSILLFLPEHLTSCHFIKSKPGTWLRFRNLI